MSVVSGGLQSGGGAAVLLLSGATGSTLTLSGSLTIPAGTAAAPTLNFSGDTTTGLYRNAAGQISIASAGVQSFTFQSNGVMTGPAGSLTMNTATGAQLAYISNSITFAGASATLNTSNGANFNVGGVALSGFTSLGSPRAGAVTISDASGTPGNATQNVPRGRAAFAAAAATCVITNSEVTADSVVMVVLETANDATLLYVRGVAPTAGSFTVTANAAATGTVIFRWFIVK